MGKYEKENDRKPKKKLENDVIAYHGTTSQHFNAFTGTPYFTPDKKEAEYYATSEFHNKYLGGGMKGTPRVLKVRLLDAKNSTLDWNDVVSETIMEMNEEYMDLDEAIDGGLKEAKKKGYKFISFYHPSSSGNDEYLVYVPVDNKYVILA